MGDNFMNLNPHIELVYSISTNCVKFLLCKLAELTIRLHCNSPDEAFMNSLHVKMTPTD